MAAAQAARLAKARRAATREPDETRCYISMLISSPRSRSIIKLQLRAYIGNIMNAVSLLIFKGFTFSLC